MRPGVLVLACSRMANFSYKASLLLLISAAATSHAGLSYDGHKVLRAKVEDEAQASALHQLSEIGIYDFWTEAVPGRTVDIRTSPEQTEQLGVWLGQHGGSPRTDCGHQDISRADGAAGSLVGPARRQSQDGLWTSGHLQSRRSSWESGWASTEAVPGRTVDIRTSPEQTEQLGV